MVTVRDETGSLFSFMKTWKDLIFLFSAYSVLRTVMFMKTYKKIQLQKITVTVNPLVTRPLTIYSEVVLEGTCHNKT